MLKKLFSLFLGVFVMFTIMPSDVRGGECGCIEKNRLETGGYTKPYFTIYFETQEPNKFQNGMTVDDIKFGNHIDDPATCKQEVQKTFKNFADNFKDDINGILVVGSASEQGTHDTGGNLQLSALREEAVVGLLNGVGLSTCRLDENNKLVSEQCGEFGAGDSISRLYTSNSRASQSAGNGENYCNHRRVDVYVFFEKDVCDAATQKLLQAEIEFFTNTSHKNNNIANNLKEAKELCDAAKNDTDYNNRLGASKRKKIQEALQTATDELIEIAKRDPVSVQKINNPTLQLTLIVGALESIQAEFNDNRTVWKDTDGNFNTARLISDSIAGVVLGTAGGLITSHIVKKKQLEKGFENIMCTVGGQAVAAYGDDFSVDIKTK